MSESRLKKSSINAGVALLQNVFSLLLTFVSRIIFVKVLDASYLGINGLFSNILNILALADLGMSTAMMYSLYKPIADHNTTKIAALIGFYRKVYILIASAVLTFGLLLIPFLKYIVNLDQSIDHLYIYYILALFNVVISYLFVYRTTLLDADQKSYILSYCVIFFKFITFILQIMVLIFTHNYLLYLLVAVLIGLISNITQNRITLKIYPFLNDKPVKLNSEERNEILKNVSSSFIYKFCATVQNNTDNILISIFVGTLYVGYYSNYSLITGTIVTIISVIFTAIKSSVGNMVATSSISKKHELKTFWTLEMVNYWIVVFCSSSFICLFQDSIELFFGSDYLLSFSVVIAIVLNFYTSNIRQTIWAYRETTGIFKQTKHITGVTALINVVLSVILGYHLNTFGIIIATVMSRMIYAWWREPQILFTMYFKCSSKHYFYKYIVRAVFAGIIIFITYFICGLVQFENPILRLLFKIGICTIVTNLLLFLLLFTTQEFKDLKTRLIVVVNNKFSKVK